MRYFLDTEFNGFGGDIISLALVSEDERSLYLVTDCPRPEPWVKANVIPILDANTPYKKLHKSKFPIKIQEFLKGDKEPVIVTDWPDDVRYFCESVITAPGKMIDVPRLSFIMVRVNAYPTELPGAVQHNALWDARALRFLLSGHK